MKTLASLSLAALAIFFALPAAADVSATVSPAGKDVGVGIQLGAPTSLNAKFMVDANQGVVVGIGGGIWYDASLSLHADYLWHPIVASFDSGAFSAYIGGGGWTSFGFGPGSHLGYYQPYYNGFDQLSFGARLPLGLSLAFNELPLELFVEAVPSVQLFPGIGVFGQGGVGARFYF